MKNFLRVPGVLVFTNIPIALIISLLILSGCSVKDQAEHDLRYPGGIVGYYGRNVLPAPTKQGQFYRAAAAYAFFSTIGARFISNPDDASAFLTRMKQVRGDLNNLAKPLALDRCYTNKSRCKTTDDPAVYYEAFEMYLPPYEEHMFKLVVSALPELKSKDVITDVASGAYLNAMRNLASDSGELLLVAHYLAADYRSSVEVVANQTTPNPIPKANVLTARASLDKPGTVEEIEWGNQAAFDFIFVIAAKSCRDVAHRFSTDFQTLTCDPSVTSEAPLIQP